MLRLWVDVPPEVVRTFIYDCDGNLLTEVTELPSDLTIYRFDSAKRPAMTDVVGLVTTFVCSHDGPLPGDEPVPGVFTFVYDGTGPSTTRMPPEPEEPDRPRAA
jgi:hypothetical protein